MRWLSDRRFWQLYLVVPVLLYSGCATKEAAAANSKTPTAYLEAFVPVWVVSLDGKRISNESREPVFLDPELLH